MTDTPHDTLFKSTFLHLPWATEVLRAALPPAVTAPMDLASLEVVPGSFIDPAYRHSHTDLLYMVRRAGRPALVYYLYEHQSRDDYWMALRLYFYEGNIWDAFRRDHPDVRHIPPIFAIVLHHGDRPWSAPTRFEQLVDLPVDDPAARAFVPCFRFALDDLSAVPAADLHTRAVSASVELVLLALKHTRGARDVAALLRGWVDLMSAVQREPSGPEALRLVFRYILEVRGAADRGILEVVATEVEKGVQANMQTIAQWLEERGEERGRKEGRKAGRKEGRKEGRQEGRKEGRTQGRQEGQRGLLLRLLRLRFGEVPAAVLVRVETADESAVERWAERLFTAETLEEVFAGE